jgi:5S rRNA maturation endonuclease (ribonuclease M5)
VPCQARVFILAIGDASGEEMAQTFIQALDNIKRFIKGNQAPFIAKVYQNSRVTIWQNHTKLLKILQRSNEL